MRATPDAPTTTHGSSVSRIACCTFLSLIADQYCFSQSSSWFSIGPSVICWSSRDRLSIHWSRTGFPSSAVMAQSALRALEQQQALLHGSRDCLGACCNAELLEQQLEMSFDRVCGNAKPSSDLLIHQAICEQGQDFLLSSAQGCRS